jgi:hypothetical protein
MLRQPLARPVVRERAGSEGGAVNLTQLGVQRQRIDFLDYEDVKPLDRR